MKQGALEHIDEGIWWAAPFAGDGAMCVVSTSDGKVVIDTTSYPVFAQQVREAVAEEDDAPWRYVINTHRHFDHIGGNQVFERECVFVAPELTREGMQIYTGDYLDEQIVEWEKGGNFRRDWLGEDFHLVLPDVVFAGEMSLYVGNTTFRMMRLGGHNPECTAVLLEERRILIASDLVFNGRPAYLGAGDRWQWLKALNYLARLDAAIVVPGHGPVGGPELLDEQLKELQEEA